MASAPQTWKSLQAAQWIIQNEVLVGGVTPFSLFGTIGNGNNPGNVSDQVRFGTNPFGSVTSAIYIGVPKDWQTLYGSQCHLVPSNEVEYRRGAGGKIWLEQYTHTRIYMKADVDYYATMQTLINAVDVAHTILMRHAEDPNAEDVLGLGWLGWQGVWYRKQEYFIAGGIVP